MRALQKGFSYGIIIKIVSKALGGFTMISIEEYKTWSSENLGQATGRWYGEQLSRLGKVLDELGIASKYKANFFDYTTYDQFKEVYQSLTGESDEVIEEILLGVRKKYPKLFQEKAKQFREGFAQKEYAEGVRSKPDNYGGIPALGAVLRSYLKFLYYHEHPDKVYPRKPQDQPDLEYIDWSQFYMELADVLLTFKDNRQSLLEKLQNIYRSIDIVFPTLERDGSPIDIDPFTVYGFFNRQVPRQLILNGFKEEFEMESPVPESDVGTPTVLPFNFTYFKYEDKREEDDIDNLWALFETALKYSENHTQDLENELIDRFNQVTKQYGIKWNITWGLYWIRPYTFIHLNANNRKFIDLSMPTIAHKYPGLKKGKMISGEAFIDICKLIQEEIDKSDEYNNFIEFSIAGHSHHFYEEDTDDHWTNFYTELADRLLEYKNNRGELRDKIKSVYDLVGFKFPTAKDGIKIEDIDPYTIYGFMHQKLSAQSKATIFEGIKEVFDLESPVPERFEGVPMITSYSFTQSKLLEILDEESELREHLWGFLETAILCAKNKDEDTASDLANLFNHLWKNTNLTWNLTKILYFVRPFDFIHLDEVNQYFIERELPDYVFPEAIEGAEYLALCQQIQEELEEDFVALSIKASEEETVVFNNDVYSPSLTVDEWESLIKDETIFFEDNLTIMRRFLDYGGKATCSQLANEYGKTYAYYNSHSIQLAKRIVENTEIDVYKEGDAIRWWRVLYLGEYAKEDEAGVFSWELRPELIEALKRVDLSLYSLYEEEKKAYVPYTEADFLDEVFMSAEEYETLRALLKEKKNVILQGAPGVGKTFAAKRLAWSILGEANEDRIETIQFHQNYSYEDFIMGYKPQEEGFELEDGIFLDVCEKASKNKELPYFLIIDEINRGNISKIFGELMQLIEKDYRGQQIRMPYNKKPFSVPENLFIIGMMNTADRSLALIDYALRRRFSFYEMTPGFETAGFKSYQASIDNESFNRMIRLIQRLNEEIRQDTTLGRGFCIGHSYFTGQTKESFSEDWLKRVIQFDILPMLNEYWFDDESKIDEWEIRLMDVFSDEI